MKIIHQIRLVCLLSIILVMTACDRQVYTTWECSGVFPDKQKFSFILDGSSMKIKENRELKFCGSLGNSSFFDEVCPAQIEKSKVVFIPKKGDFIEDMHAYRCFAL
jgi:hypothetical protein